MKDEEDSGMPKVTESYKQEKRKKIIRTAWEIMEQKPLYEMNMLEVVKKAGLSKGGIYLYFSDIDELLVETINAILESSKELAFSVNLTEEEAEEGLVKLFRQLGDYMEACPPIIGKIRFELGVYMTSHPEKMETILPRIRLQQTGAEFMALAGKFIQKGVEQGRFKKDLPMDAVLTNIMVYVDGMTDYVTRMKAYHGPELNAEVSVYFEQFIRSQMGGWRELADEEKERI